MEVWLSSGSVQRAQPSELWTTRHTADSLISDTDKFLLNAGRSKSGLPVSSSSGRHSSKCLSMAVSDVSKLTGSPRWPSTSLRCISTSSIRSEHFRYGFSWMVTLCARPPKFSKQRCVGPYFERFYLTSTAALGFEGLVSMLSQTDLQTQGRVHSSRDSTSRINSHELLRTATHREMSARLTNYWNNYQIFY